MGNKEQKVTITENGELLISTDEGCYKNGEWIGIISGNFSIDADSVSNLMLQYDDKGGFEQISGIIPGWVYVNEKNIAKSQSEKIESLKERNDVLVNENARLERKYNELVDKVRKYNAFTKWYQREVKIEDK